MKWIDRSILLCLKLAAVLGLLASDAKALGIVSRSCAPLGAQESVTVDWTFKKYMLWTASTHYRNGMFMHTTNTVGKGVNGWEYTWRSYAGHFGTEYYYGLVVGNHYGNDRGWYIFYGTSQASDCNLRQWGQ